MPITERELHTSLLDIGYDGHHLCTEPDEASVLMNGKLLFNALPSGLGIHCADIIEQKKATSSVELSPCISINILLQGDLKFSLGHQYYQFSASQNQPVIFINLLAQTELFTRHIIKNQHIIKANITVEKSWLLARCHSNEDRMSINNLFSNTSQVHHWPCNNALAELATSLIATNHKKSIIDVLNTEQIALQILNINLTRLKKSTCDSITSSYCNARLPNDESEQLKQSLDKVVFSNIGLKQLSNQLGISISTLQRRFKAKYNITVHHYLRQKRLEHARKALIIDGLSIGEAAFSAGYDHVANFITAFKKQYNVTPAQLRKQHLGL